MFHDLKKMKERESEREREEWAKEVLSDRNPNTLALYKKKIEEKDVQVLITGRKNYLNLDIKDWGIKETIKKVCNQ